MKKDRRYINFNDCLGIESTKTYEMIVKYLLHAKSTGYKKKKKKNFWTFKKFKEQ